MRKYTQLGLVIVCVLSIGGLLVMERRYSHMKVFLEVTDLFQTSDAKVKCHQQLESLRTNLENAYLDQTHRIEPQWRQTNSFNFVYSAFYLSQYAKVIILMVSPTKPDFCRLWFDGKTQSIIDQSPSSKVIAAAGDLSALAVNCTNFNATSTPKAVEVDGILIPVEVVPSPTADAVDSVAVCLRPLTISSTEVHLAEFLTYYNYLGVTQFYVYDESLPSDVKIAVKRAGFIDTSLRSQLLPWNLPFSVNATLAEAILKADCFLRSGTTSKYAAVMAIDEFFVVRREPANITSFLRTVLRPGQVLAVHERLFCDEFADDVIASALDYPFVTLRKTRFTRNAVQHRITFAYAGSLAALDSLLRGGMSHSGTKLVSYVSEMSGHVNKYTACSQMHFWMRKNNLLRQQQQQQLQQQQLQQKQQQKIESNSVSVDDHLTKLHQLLFASKLYKHAVHLRSPVYRLIA